MAKLDPSDLIPGDIATLVDDYLDHRRLRGAAANTLAAYRADLVRLAGFLRRFDVTLVQLVSERLINQWLDYGLGHEGWSRRTAARRLAAVRTFMAWCRGQGLMRHDATADVRIKFRPRLVVAPELEPLKQMIAGIGQREPVDLRDRAMLLLMLDAALRAGEVVLLDDAPLNPRGYTVLEEASRVYVKPKGGDEGEFEVVGIEQVTVAAVQAWRRVRAKMARPDEPALFVNLHGRRLSRQALYLAVRDRGAAAGLPHLHPHLLRHRRLGEVVEKAGLDAGSALARHKHKSTTVNVYGAHAAAVQRAAIRTLAPLGELPCNA
ncbi:tyrosine-type recombinase/integrase [Stenotrophomonas sp. MMGLT7]|uniref:site-specific integrase n=1 Tax=Stenotrophomonas sp. MMGLT7 TaxID=2901227 RepID=UPI001E57AC27|nr:tyrosine-type recombinase/integrase [Stenotrophomonas sp. MMGLT7]MCD7096909.1 tyrosine-type recombinase/integrase [Stenotrophomonas sp. MMGLT7]